ncbi:hypothetical protein [Aneurinibacillus terranovensis]|uniref:hypothetical protein n=1 Tax=Aneurinibacillus terranovensis TaxID=278991 RepID=UPI0003F6662E|nr:hypothetical protein [Aneurinibacillus terranovensis]
MEEKTITEVFCLSDLKTKVLRVMNYLEKDVLYTKEEAIDDFLEITRLIAEAESAALSRVVRPS